MKYKQIIIIILLLCLSIISYLSLQQQAKVDNKLELNSTVKINIPKIVIPKKSMEFNIVKDIDGNISFNGTFETPETPKEIARWIYSDRLKYKIKIDDRIEDSNRTVQLIKRVLNRLTDSSYSRWSILYRDRKLLVSGETSSKEDKDSLERILNLSTLNIFSHIELVDKKQVETLKVIKMVANEEEEKLSKDDIDNIMLTLKSLAVEEPEIKEKIIKKYIKKKIVVKKQEAKVQEEEPIYSESDERIVIDRQKEEDIDIMSLPFVQPIDSIDVESMSSKKHFIKKETIYIQSDDYNNYENIPSATLHNIDDKVDGIFIPELYNK